MMNKRVNKGYPLQPVLFLEPGIQLHAVARRVPRQCVSLQHAVSSPLA